MLTRDAFLLGRTMYIEDLTYGKMYTVDYSHHVLAIFAHLKDFHSYHQI